MPYALWSKRVVEQCNGMILDMITHFVADKRHDWDEHLWAVVMAYNATHHKSTG
jgi:hypothetical protein